MTNSYQNRDGAYMTDHPWLSIQYSILVVLLASATAPSHCVHVSPAAGR